ncbi:MAG: tetratricopeptide repeat protein [Bacteroidota bacterium]
MDKNLFIKVLHHYSGSSTAEAQEVLSLKQEYPYSQLLHALSARVTKDHGFSNHQQELQMAAVYAADRAVLKNIMTHEPEIETIDSEPEKESVIAETPPKKTRETRETRETATETQVTNETIRPTHLEITSTIDAVEDVADAVIRDLQRLSELKHNYEMMFTETTPVASIETTIKAKEVEPNEDSRVKTKVPPAKRDESHPHESVKSKRQRMIEMAKALSSAEEPPAKTNITKSPSHKSKGKNTTDELIEEIKTSKQEIKVETKKQKEQIEIIDQFIKTQPSISNPKERAVPPPEGDLNSVKSGEFSDNIVSETLAEILIKQGKKDKAIEVLKKLIWKFPQKKAYFAAQIEELKK